MTKPLGGPCGGRSVGVEEEFLLFDATSLRPAPLGDDVAEVAVGGRWARPRSPRARALGGVTHEFKLEQVEAATEPCRSLEGLRADLVGRRAVVADRAAALGAVAAALATSPVPAVSTLTPGRRYQRMSRAYGLVAEQALTCGMHVHVEVASPEEGVGVIDRIRTWLPLLLALSANSPYWQGRDTGAQSFRSISWSIWPTAGPTEVFASLAGYRAVVERLVAAGAALDPAMIYFDARLSPRYPTVEIRVADVCPAVDDAVALAAVARGLVSTAARDWAAGLPPPAVPREIVRAGSWQAAVCGLSGTLLDGATLRPVTAARAVRGLLRHVGPALEASGDTGATVAAVERILQRGTGADLQRRVVAGGGDLTAVVTEVAGVTARP